MAELAKSLLAMRETWVRSLSWEDPLEEGKAAHSSAPWEALAGYFENIFMLSVLTLLPHQLPTVCGLG